MERGVKRRCRVCAASLAGLLAAAAQPTTAASSSTIVAWSTYLRAGPGESYEAVTELEHDTRVVLVSCSGRWCRISGDAGTGYVDRSALELPRTLAPEPPARTDCVVVGQADNRGPIATRFCSGTPGRP